VWFILKIKKSMKKPNLVSSKFKQGLFKPYYLEKYVGDTTNIKYRSGWERKFMVWCDRNPDIKKWSSEPISIKYINPLDKKEHSYFVDFWIDYGNDIKYLIEIKPYCQTLKPIFEEKEGKSKMKRQRDYIINMKNYIINRAKWSTAEDFCMKVGWKFKVITEKDQQKLFK